jgi:hypothetical protein
VPINALATPLTARLRQRGAMTHERLAFEGWRVGVHQSPLQPPTRLKRDYLSMTL